MKTLRTILICASHESYDAVIEWQSRLTIDEYHVVLSPPLHKEELDEEKTNISNALQLAKIEFCDDLFVLDVGGKIDKRLIFQIKKAQELKKRIIFLSQEFPDWKPGDYLYAKETDSEYKEPNLKETLRSVTKLKEDLEIILEKNKKIIG